MNERRGYAALFLSVSASAAFLTCCKPAPQTQQGVNLVDAEWTDAAASRKEALVSAKKATYSLPELRVFDAAGRLVFVLDASKPWDPAEIGRKIDDALRVDRPIEGPDLRTTFSELQTRDGRPVRSVAGSGHTLVFDYWASWCVPCRILGKSLLQWQATKPPGSVQIIKAETDLMKLQRSRGMKVIMIKG